eukprot:1375847-Amorphochlora_amoeboformis.AAC.1
MKWVKKTLRKQVADTESGQRATFGFCLVLCQTALLKLPDLLFKDGRNQKGAILRAWTQSDSNA